MRFVLGALVWLIVILLLGFPLIILSLVKLVVIRIHRNERVDVDNVTPLSKGDCIVARASSWKRSRVNVGFVLKVGGKVEVEHFREHFANCFNLHNDNGEFAKEAYSKFFEFLDTRGGYVFRVSSKRRFNLSEQIVERKLAVRQVGGEDEKTGTESLEEFLAQWILEEYRENQPCWEIAVVSIPSSEDPTTAICFKIHHGISDGYSLLHIIDKLTGTKSPYLVKDFQDGFCTQLKQMLEAPLNLGRLSGVPPEMNPFTVKERTYEWIYSFTSFSLEDLKTLRRKNGGVHMLSVIWTIVTGAMRRFLLEEMQMQEVPEFVKIGNTLPWPRHPAMNSATNNQDKICNHWVAGIFQVPLREPDPLVRLQQIEEEYLTYISLGLDKFAKRILYPVLWTMPGSLIESALIKDLGISGGLTSLIGGDSYKLFGHPVKNIHPILAIHDNSPYMPLSCFTFSHSDRLELTMGANPRSVIGSKQNLDKICHNFCHNEITNLLAVTTQLK